MYWWVRGLGPNATGTCLSLASPETQGKDHGTLGGDTGMRHLEAEVSLGGHRISFRGAISEWHPMQSALLPLSLGFPLCTEEGTQVSREDLTKPWQRAASGLLLCLNILHMTLTSCPSTGSPRALVTRNTGCHRQLCRRPGWL